MDERDYLKAKRNAARLLPEPHVRRAIRVAASLSQEDLARVLGVERATVGRWETGKRSPTGSHLVTYVDLLDEIRRDG